MLEVTSLEQLKEMAKGEIVPLPSFINGIPFVARLKRPSLLGLIQQGKIPNQLLSAANELFYGKSSHKKEDESLDMKEMSEVMMIMAKSALVEPTHEQLDELGMELTDEQIVTLFNYTQKGLKAIEKFCQEPEDNVNTSDEQKIQNETEPGPESN